MNGLGRSVVLISLAALLAQPPSEGQEQVDVPKLGAAWSAMSSPPTADSWRCVGFRPRQYAEVNGDVIRIVPEPTRKDGPSDAPPAPMGEGGRRSSMRVNTSWLLGFDRGEFGGSLWLLAAEGAYVRLHEGPTLGFVRTARHIAVLTGLSHMSMNSGAILLFDPVDLRARPVRIETKGSPTVGASEPEGGLMYATSVGVFRLQPDGTSTLVVPLGGELSSPTSLAVSGQVVVLAYRHFVLVTSAGRKTWYVEKACPQLVESAESSVGCSCWDK